ncbi:MAG: hypothetical protein KBE17_06745 [Acidovorax sp.]|jgi:hypothetical protein|nr:hypothetical protein [Acidovorax sp.]
MSNFLLTTFIPALGVVISALLLIYGVYYRWVDVPQKWLLTPGALIGMVVVAVLCNGWLGVRMYLSQSAQQAWHDSAAVRASRERFVLPQDFQYGELLVPAGSLINRTDPLDRGAPTSPLALHGLDAVRFPQPVVVAGVLVNAMQVLPMRLELAENQRIGPAYRYDTASQNWVPNKVVPYLNCKKGQIATFQVPHIAYDVAAEVGKAPPDGPLARFAPSQWLFKACEAAPPVTVQEAAPVESAKVWVLPPPPVPAEPASAPEGAAASAPAVPPASATAPASSSAR